MEIIPTFAITLVSGLLIIAIINMIQYHRRKIPLGSTSSVLNAGVIHFRPGQGVTLSKKVDHSHLEIKDTPTEANYMSFAGWIK